VASRERANSLVARHRAGLLTAGVVKRLIRLLALLLGGPPAFAAGTGVVVEAESGALANAMRAYASPSASGGYCIQVVSTVRQDQPSPLATPDARYSFTVPAAGSYKVYLRAYAPNEASNSFHYRWDDAAYESRGATAGPAWSWQETGARTLAAGFDGEPFNRPNDLVVDRRGGVYFTDPGQGLGPDVGKGRLPVSIYYIPAGRPARRVATDIAFPNGILLSRDERTLYVNDSRGRHLLAFDVGRGGALERCRVFATYDDVRQEADGTLRSGADGLAIDSEGRLYSATPAGVRVYDATGRQLGTIPTPRPAQNLAFAGPRKDVLYVVARGALFRIAMQSRGYAGRAK
jgi:gluconolactonase